MFEVTYCFLTLNGVLFSAFGLERSSQSSVTITKKRSKPPFDLEFLCDATLITYSSAITSCECATHVDFVFPEFNKKKPMEYNLTTRRNVVMYGYQSLRISMFTLHPKCTSSSMIAGFFSYNYALVLTETPFARIQQAVTPVDLPALDYNTVNLTLWKALSKKGQACEVIGWAGDLIQPISVDYNKDCEKKLCEHLGKACPLSLEEKGLLCLVVNENFVVYDYPDYPSERQLQNETSSSWKDEAKCTKPVLSGSPLLCFGFFMGVIAPGLCTIEVPLVVARIEPALEFIYNHIENGVSTSAVLWPLIAMRLFSLLIISIS